jgi:hypothetical protein
MTAQRKYRPFADGLVNGSNRPKGGIRRQQRNAANRRIADLTARGIGRLNWTAKWTFACSRLLNSEHPKAGTKGRSAINQHRDLAAFGPLTNFGPTRTQEIEKTQLAVV